MHSISILLFWTIPIPIATIHITVQKQYTDLNAQLPFFSAQVTLIDVAGNETFTDIISLTRTSYYIS